MISAFFLSAACLAGSLVTVRPLATDEVLVNPGMGLVYYHYDNRIWAYGTVTRPDDTLDWFPGVSVIYFRVPWCALEPEEGVLRWDAIDTFARSWVAKGRKLAFRITCCEKFEDYATPRWVEKAGAKGNVWHYKDNPDMPRWEPVYDDPVFLEKLSNMICAFARRYDGNPDVAFVDVGSFGLYGEGHVGQTSKLPESERFRLGRLHMELWRKAMPRTRLVMSDDVFSQRGGNDPEPGLMAYAIGAGIGFRDDSLYLRTSNMWRHDAWAREFAKAQPVVLEPCHYMSTVIDGAWALGRQVESVEAHQASYFGIHGFPDVNYRGNEKLFADIARRLGYRFELREVRYPAVAEIGRPVQIETEWVNVGVARRYDATYLSFALLDERGNAAWIAPGGDFDFAALEPKLSGVERPVRLESVCRFGYLHRVASVDDSREAEARKLGYIGSDGMMPTLKPGVYELAVSLGRADGIPEIALPISGGRNRVYPIGKIEVR